MLRPGQAPANFDEAVGLLEATLERAVTRRTRSDVGYGVLLSGGLDSAGMAGMLRAAGADGNPAFTIGFGDTRFDEVPRARRTAERLGFKHHVATLGPDALDELPALVRHGAEPTADSSMLAVDRLCRLAAEHVPVVLGGDGADELFAGYPTYTATLAAVPWRALPR